VTAPSAAEARLSWTRFRIEVHDPIADEWVAAGSAHATLAAADASAGGVL
jgi:hypothetical protein